ncbi:FKBP-type peptidyl-prolyl cis-trans isomerase [Brachybacterium sp. EF45031]|uniref:FKBP-type peptidyl-prolyl cis-trans isomerase n=1 Tax=Brachybacterium sillae TaxID=2810536 RepID=UPI00217EBEC9|nr:FKBP-type peptidyl-prolyl cis-trans isomerase [Brachybacterium sillae]MCS6710676.1 FKBP-type peptidyl-prolyl cis-trans isomerase [Brachybacterium sillae]
MIRRRSVLTAALGGAGALALAACQGQDDAGGGGGGSGASDAGGSDASALAGVTIGGPADGEPTVSFSAPLSITRPEGKVVTTGSGEPLTAGQSVITRSVYVNAADGTVLQSYWKGAPESVLSVVPEMIGEPAAQFLTGVPLGSRVAMTGWQRSQDGSTFALVQVADLVEAIAARASGTPQTPDPALPAVTLADNGAPSLEAPPTGNPPTETQRSVLIQGTGRPTAAGDTLYMHYTGWKWSDGSTFDSSWERGAPFSFVLGQQQVITGWDAQLVGLPVGSQVELVIPPKDAYAGSGNELENETLVFVADILHASAPRTS